MPLSMPALAFAGMAAFAAPPPSLPVALPSEEATVDVERAVHELLQGREVGRIGILPVEHPDAAQRARWERALAVAAREATLAEVLTAARVRGAEGAGRSAPGDTARVLGADLAIAARTIDVERGIMSLSLVDPSKGIVLSTLDVALGSAAADTRAKSLRGALAMVADDLAEAIELRGRSARHTQVSLAVASGADEAYAEPARHALRQAMLERGFVMLDRRAVVRAESLGDATFSQAGRALGADAVVVVSTAAAGDRVELSARLLDTERAIVLASSTHAVPRAGVASLSFIEKRSAFEVALQSAVAPGWGQASLGDGVGAAVFSTLGYGTALATVGLAVGAVASGLDYENGAGDRSPDEVQAARLRTDLLGLCAGALGAAFVVTWASGIVHAALSAPLD